MLFTVIVEQVSDVYDALVTQNARQLSEKLVIVVHLQDRAQILGLQFQDLFHLIDAGRARTQASGSVDAMQNERRIERRLARRWLSYPRK